MTTVCAEMEHRHATVNGVRLHYVTAGEGKLIVFVHGFPEFWYAWKRQLEEFSRDHQAVAVDLRGFNLSEKPAEVAQYRMTHIAEDLRQLIAHLGHRSAIVVAHDWGGAAAWYLAARHPEAVEKLVIINSPHPATFARELAANPRQRAASAYIKVLIDSKAEEFLSANDYEWMVKALRRHNRESAAFDAQTLAHYRAAWAQPGALTASLNYYRASPLVNSGTDPDLGRPRAPRPTEPRSGSVPEFPTISVPTLVIWGMRDEALLPCLLDGLDAHVSNLRIERVSEGTHWVVHEFPERVNAAIRDFLGH